MTADASKILGDLAATRQLVQNVAAGPLRDGIAAAGRTYMGFVRDRFDRNSEGGGDWPPLKDPGSSSLGRPGTVKLRNPLGDQPAKQTADRRILVKTGRLRESLEDGSPENIEEDLPNGVLRGTSVPYARYQNDGTDRIPARPFFVDPDSQTERRIAGQMTDGLLDAIRQL